MNKAAKSSIRNPSVICALEILRVHSSGEGGHSKRRRSRPGGERKRVGIKLRVLPFNEVRYVDGL